MLAGYPLIRYTIEVALSCSTIDNICVSTDSRRIADFVMQLGVKVPALRPEHLAADDTEMIDVLRFEIGRHEDACRKEIDAIVLLQPTSPLRKTEDVEMCVELYERKRPDAVISVNVCRANPYKNMLIKKGEYYDLAIRTQEEHTNREKMPVVYEENGAVYVVSRRSVMSLKTVHPPKTLVYEMPQERSIDIDSEYDLGIAEYLFTR